MTTTNWNPQRYLTNREIEPSFYSRAHIWLLKNSLTRAKRLAVDYGSNFRVRVTIELIQMVPDGINPLAASMAPFSLELTEAATELIHQRFDTKLLQVVGRVNLRPAGLLWGKYRFMMAEFDVI